MNAETSNSRRQFLKAGALVGGGLVIGFVIPGARRLSAQPAAAAAVASFAPNAYLRIGTDDTVTVLSAHSEMGQGIWTTLPMLIAEELDADWSKIKVEHAPAAPEYFSLVFGMQGTGGSTSTASEFDRYRQAGAAARAMLVQAAATRFNVPIADIRTENGEVIAGTQRVRYGALADDAGKLKAPDATTLVLKDPKDWKIIGKPTKRLDSPEKITGRAQFGMDVQFEGLLTAVVARVPGFGGKVKSFDATAAKAVAGVRNVVQIPSGIAVIAAGGAQARNIFWQVGTSATLDTGSSFKGTILAGQSITMNTTSSLEGRALAFTGQVAFSGNGGSLPEPAVPRFTDISHLPPDSASVVLDTTPYFLLTLQSSPGMAPADWTTLAEEMPAATPWSFTNESLAAGVTTRFYRAFLTRP